MIKHYLAKIVNGFLESTGIFFCAMWPCPKLDLEPVFCLQQTKHRHLTPATVISALSYAYNIALHSSVISSSQCKAGRGK